MGQTIDGNEKIIVKKEKNNLFLVIYILSVLSIIIAPLAGKVFAFISVLFFILSLVLFPNQYAYILLYSFFPFANIFKLSPETMSFLTVCEMLLLIKIIFDVLLKRKTIRFSVALPVGLALTIVHIVLFSTKIDYLNVVKLIARVLLIAYYLRAIIREDDSMQLAKMMGCYFSASMLLMMLLSQSNAYMDTVSAYLRIVQFDASGEIVRNGGLLDDPNYCSLAIMASLTFLTVLYYYKLIKFKYWLLAVPLFLLGFTTYSKSYFLTAIAFLAALLLLILFPKHKVLAVILCIILGVVASAVYSGQVEIINRILSRFNTENIYTGRDRLNQIYLNYIFESTKVLLFGEGFDATVLSYAQNNVHNLYIEMLFRLGIFGSLLLLITIKFCFPKKHAKSRLVNYIPALFVLTMYMALAGMDSYGLFYYILLAGVSILYINDKKRIGHQMSERVG